jgi:cytochrome P450
VLGVLGAANRDPEQFPHPDRFDITRTDNRHLAFGAGVNFCVGTPLSRVEAQIASPLLLRRMPELCLAEESLEWRRWESWRGLAKLPLVF